MLIHELIEQLQQCNQMAEVNVSVYDRELLESYLHDIRSISPEEQSARQTTTEIIIHLE